MKYSLAITLLMSISISLSAQNGAAILGKWLDHTGDAQILIYKVGNKYFGKLAWLKEPNEKNGKPKTDKNSGHPERRNTPLVGLEILKDFSFDGKTYDGGTVYDPQNGKTYRCEMTLKGDALKMRGYIGFSLFGRTEVWSRVKE